MKRDHEVRFPDKFWRRGTHLSIDAKALYAVLVTFADYKTGESAPIRPAHVPPAYVAQLALYRGVLHRLYQDRPVRAVLVWTHAPDLMELSGADLDAALNTSL